MQYITRNLWVSDVTSSQVSLLTTARQPIRFQNTSLFRRKLGQSSRQFFPKAQGKMSYFSSSSSSSISFARYLESEAVVKKTFLNSLTFEHYILCLQSYEKIHSIVFTPSQFCPPEVCINHGQQILQEKKKYLKLNNIIIIIALRARRRIEAVF